MKNQASFSLKNKSKKLKCCLLQFLYGSLRVKCEIASLRNSLIWLYTVYLEPSSFSVTEINMCSCHSAGIEFIFILYNQLFCARGLLKVQVNP